VTDADDKARGERARHRFDTETSNGPDAIVATNDSPDEDADEGTVMVDRAVAPEDGTIVVDRSAPDDGTVVVDRSSPEDGTIVVDRSAPEDGTIVVDRSAPEDGTVVVDRSAPDDGTVVVDRSAPDDGTVVVDRSAPDDGTVVVDRSAPDDGTVVVDRSSPDDGTLVIDRAAPDDGTAVVERPDAPAKRPPVMNAPTRRRNRREVTLAPGAGANKEATLAAGPGAVAAYPARAILAPPSAAPIIELGPEASRADAPSMPSVAKQSRRRGLIALAVAGGAVVVSVIGLIAIVAALING
jgi:hypothetical protein